MALFKIFRGVDADFRTKKTNAVEGYAYFITDTGKMYIDIATANSATLGTNRIELNAGIADLAKTVTITTKNATGKILFNSSGNDVYRHQYAELTAGTGVTALSLGSNVNGAEKGAIRLYGTNTGYVQIETPLSTTSNYSFTIPPVTGKSVGYAVTIPALAAVGSATQPVYVDKDGQVVAANTYKSLFTAFSLSTNTLSITVGGTTLTSPAVSGVSSSWIINSDKVPQIKVIVNGVSHTEVAIPAANGTDAAGIVTIKEQSFAGNKTFLNNVAINGTLGVTGATALSSTLTVTGKTTLNGALEAKSTATVTGVLTANGNINSTHILPITNGKYDIGSTDYKWVNVYAANFKGNADTASLASTLTVTNTDATNRTLYVLGVTASGTATNRPVYADSDIRFSTVQGIAAAGETAATAGYARLMLGNTTANTEAGGADGRILLYTPAATYYVTIATVSNTANRTLYVPALGGTRYIANVAGVAAIGSTTLPVYVAANGEIKVCDSAKVFNKFDWTDGTTEGPILNATVFNVTNNAKIPSATASKSGVVTTTDQTFAGNKTFNGATTISNTLTVSGVTKLNSTLAVGSNTTIGGTLTVTGGTTLNSTLSVSSTATIGGLLTANAGISSQGNVSPSKTGTYTLGTSSLYWSAAYITTLNSTTVNATTVNATTVTATTFNGSLSGNASSATYASKLTVTSSDSDGNLLFVATASGNVAVSSHPYVKVLSTVGTNTFMQLGNTAAGSKGVLRLRGTSTGYVDIYSGITGADATNFVIPPYTGTGYAVTAASASAVGGAAAPVYLAANGRITACTANFGTLTAYTSSANTMSITVGANTKSVNIINSHSLSWGAGTSAGPTLTVTANGVATSAVAIPVASASASGVVTNAAQTFAGTKTFNGGVALAAGQMVTRAGKSSSWYNARDNCMIKHTSLSGYSPFLTMVGASGDWSLGMYTSDGLHLTYTTNTKYTGADNTKGPCVTLDTAGKLTAPTVAGAIWNDYAEYRAADEKEPGRVCKETGFGNLVRTNKRLEPACIVISDTFGFSIGETEECSVPFAVAGRVLAYPYEDRDSYAPGDAVCSGPEGTVSKMTREEIMMYPERIIGTVSEIPAYEHWGTGNVEVNGRIWIKVR